MFTASGGEEVSLRAEINTELTKKCSDIYSNWSMADRTATELISHESKE